MEIHTRPRRAKVFGDGPALPLDRNAKARIMVFARAWTARHRQPGQHIGPISRAMFDVLRVLLWECHNALSGRCFPGYETIAAKAQCAVSTVHKAIQALEAAGILSWVNRLAFIRDRCVDAAGKVVWHPRVIRTSNAYVFHDPVENRGKPPNSSKSENRAGSFYQDFQASSLTAGMPVQSGDNRFEAGVMPA